MGSKYYFSHKPLWNNASEQKTTVFSIRRSYCVFNDKGELYIKGMHIAEFKQSGKHQNHEPLREKKLLLTKKELKKLFGQTTIKGHTIVPVNIHITGKGLIKLDIALAKGKQLHDKRESIKERDVKRDLDREYKQ